MMKTLLLAALAVTGAMGQDNKMIEGKADSTVRVIVFEDLQCPDCAVFRQMLDKQLLPKYGAKVAFEHRDFALPKHAWARPAAAAARFFYQQKPELGFEFRRWAFANMQAITPENLAAKVAEFAKSHKVDAAAAQASLTDVRLLELADTDMQEGVARGVARTPTVFVNGQPFVETFTYDEISRAIEANLKP